MKIKGTKWCHNCSDSVTTVSAARGGLNVTVGLEGKIDNFPKIADFYLSRFLILCSILSRSISSRLSMLLFAHGFCAQTPSDTYRSVCPSVCLVVVASFFFRDYVNQ